MMKIHPFGNIDLENVEEYYDGEVQIQGNTVEIDLNFESESISKSDLAKIEIFLNDIESFVCKAFDEISKDYELDEETGTAKFYLQHHLNQLAENQVKDIFGKIDIDKDTFLNTLKTSKSWIIP
jgi:hypothetical protein